MSLLERHRYMISRLAEAFGTYDDNAIERMMLQPGVLQTIDYFFSASGPTKVLIALEAVEEEPLTPGGASQPSSIGRGFTSDEDDENGDEEQVEEEKEEPLAHRLRVYSQDIDYIPSTTVFFMKNRRTKDNEVNFSIDPTRVNDGALSFGVLRQPLESLEVMMRCVYKPMIMQMGGDTWGQASTEHKYELLGCMDSFTKGLQESIRSISGGLELKKPDERVEALGSSAAADPGLVVQCLNLLQEWCLKIERYLDDSDRSRWETPDSGPDTELVYWRNRTAR
jgi:hypothetical protein